ncbi:MAG: AMP-binding protein, partial [Phycisphaerales bacterium]|nr:AMP-binding protein [Phycisphaerales bacterium]
SVAAAFEASVARDPDAIAIVDGGLSITYRELDSWSRAVASELIRKGIEHGEAVALTGLRSASTIAGMLGVTRAGGFFVPIDSDFPEARIRAQMASIRPRFGVGPKISMVLSGNVENWIDLDSLRNSTADASLPVLNLETPFYAMFTSGTTGEPRGALVPHRAVLRLAQDPWFLPKSPSFKMLHAAPIAFDASTLEIWWPLLNGLTVVCWGGKGSDLQGIGTLIRKERIDGCWLTAALFHTAVDQMPHIFESMSVVLTGGDVVSAAHASRIGIRYPDLVLVNGYGPTENTVFTTCELIKVERGQIDGPISIGRPVRGTRVRILDDRGKRVPVGRFGELVTDGAGLAMGYLDPVSNVKLSGGFEGGTSKGTLYRTGDRARWLQDGRIEFNGRIDHQVKVNGHRVELSAIDSVIRRIAEVEDVATMLLETPGRSKSIGAVIVQSARGSIDRDTVRNTLASELPAWEIPAEIMFVDQIPSTSNGKVDRKSCARVLLESRSTPPSTGSIPEERADEIDVILRRAVEEISGRRLGSRSMTLSEVGIDSIELLRLSIRLEDLLSRPIHLESLVATASLSDIAASIRENIQLEAKEIVELRPSEAFTSRGVFCVPGVGGTVFSFLSLLDGIPLSIPVFGLPYPGTGGCRPPLRNIESMAKHFAKTIIATEVTTPCLVGYSLGGFVAFEIARNLKESGIDPKLLIIDAPLSQLPRRRKWSGGKIVTRAELRVRLANVLPDAMADVMAGKNGRQITSLRRVIAGSFSAWRAYLPQTLDVDMTLVRSRDDIQDAERHDPTLGWREMARSVAIQEIPGSHLEVFRVGSMELSRIIVDAMNNR